MFVDQTSPPAALLADEDPTARSAAEPTGSGAVAPPASAGPTTAPPGAAAVIPRGRSAGAHAEGGTVSAWPAGSLLSTVTCSDKAAGVCPAAAVPKLRLARSRAIETAGATSSSTEAPAAAVPVGGVTVPQVATGDEPFRGAGVPAAKSALLTSVSSQPAPLRRAAVVFVSAGAPAEPS